MKAPGDELQRILSGSCLIAAPLLILVSEALRFYAEPLFFWHPVLSIVAIALSTQAILGLRHLLLRRAPRLAVIGCGLALMLTLPGSNIMTTRLIHWAIAPDASAAAAFEKAVRGLFVVIFVPGALYPLVRAALAAGLWRAGVVPVWVGVLMTLGYLLFPVGRIGLMPPIIHLSDALLLLTEGWLGWKILARGNFWGAGEAAEEDNLPRGEEIRYAGTGSR